MDARHACGEPLVVPLGSAHATVALAPDVWAGDLWLMAAVIQAGTAR